jgi:hypothetical protein
MRRKAIKLQSKAIKSSMRGEVTRDRSAVSIRGQGFKTKLSGF